MSVETEPLILSEVKKHCRIDFEDDDNLLISYITAAREWAENFLNRDFSEEENIKQVWKQAMLLTIAQWYENRENLTSKKPIPTAAEYLLWPDRNVPT